MSPLDPIFQVNELPFQSFLGTQTPSTYPLPLPLMSRATIIYLNICTKDGFHLHRWGDGNPLLIAQVLHCILSTNSAPVFQMQAQQGERFWDCSTVLEMHSPDRKTPIPRWSRHWQGEQTSESLEFWAWIMQLFSILRLKSSTVANTEGSRNPSQHTQASVLSAKHAIRNLQLLPGIFL